MIYCPRCEKPLEGHDDGACARRMSRRFFFGVVGGGIVAAQAVPMITAPNVISVNIWANHQNEWVFTSGPIAHPSGFPEGLRMIYEATLESKPPRMVRARWTDGAK